MGIRRLVAASSEVLPSGAAARLDSASSVEEPFL